MKAIFTAILLLLLVAAFYPDTEIYVREVPPCEKNLDDKENIKGCIRQIFKEEGDTAIAVAMAESKLDHSSVNENVKKGKVWSRDNGIFQLNDHFHPGTETMNERQNIEYAYSLYKKTGWKSWAAYNNGSWKKFATK